MYFLRACVLTFLNDCIFLKTKKEDLQVACSKFGPFTEIVLPKCKDARYPDSCAGFGFVQYKVKKDAENALNKLNLSKVCWFLLSSFVAIVNDLIVPFALW